MPKTTNATKDKFLAIRITDEDKTLIRLAAAGRGLSIQQFILSTAKVAAEADVFASINNMSQEQQEMLAQVAGPNGRKKIKAYAQERLEDARTLLRVFGATPETQALFEEKSLQTVK